MTTHRVFTVNLFITVSLAIQNISLFYSIVTNIFYCELRLATFGSACVTITPVALEIVTLPSYSCQTPLLLHTLTLMTSRGKGANGRSSGRGHAVQQKSACGLVSVSQTWEEEGTHWSSPGASPCWPASSPVS